MSEICPVCGCKTESFDFANIAADEGFSVCACDYCRKQLEALKTAEVSDAEVLTKIQPKVRWLDTVLQKSVEERDAQCTRMLAATRNRFPAWLSEHAAPPIAAGTLNYPTAETISAESGEIDPASAKKIASLEARLSKLEKNLRNFKRGLLISTILEIVIPVIVFVITAIVFFRSDMWFTLQSLLNQATGGGYTIF